MSEFDRLKKQKDAILRKQSRMSEQSYKVTSLIDLSTGLKKQYDALLDKEKAKVQKLYDALKRISLYESSAKLNNESESCYGLAATELVEMSYDHAIAEARNAIKGMRRP